MAQSSSAEKTGKTVLVTGASRGIGRAVAERFARDGYDVVVNCRAPGDEAHAVCAAVEAAGRRAYLCCFDVGDRAAAAAALTLLCDTLRISACVLCAGIHDDEALVFMTDAQWDSVLNVNLNGFYNVVRPVLKQMLLNRDGRIIAVASTSGESGLAGQTNYAAAKAGLIGAVKALALECAKRNVLVNAVSPGFIETDMTAGLDIKERSSHIPLGRFGKPADVAAAAAFLASGDASYITGQVLRVNGGVYL